MPSQPSFNAAQLEQLRSCGVIDTQIEQLNRALHFMRAWLRPQAANNDIAAILEDVSRLSDKLGRKLSAIASRIDVAHAHCFSAIEIGHRLEAPGNDIDRNVTDALRVQLDRLSRVAKAGRQSLPATPTRYRAADPRPVLLVADALLRGWNETYSTVVHSPDARSKSAPRYPKEFRHSGRGSKFADIVRICYQAIGKKEPDRAIKAFRKHSKASRGAAITAFNALLKSVTPPE